MRETWFNAPNFVFGLALFLMMFGLALGISSLAGLYETAGATLAAAGGTMMAAGGVLMALFQFVRVDEENQSRFYLEQAVRGIERAHALLEDGNNQRHVWVLAGRILARSKSLYTKLTVPAHREAFEIVADDYRVRFHRILRAGETDTAAFFYGSPDHNEPLRDAAARQAQNHEAMPIPEAALTAIFEFADYPDDYEDPLSRRFSDRELHRLSLLFPALHRFVRFIRRTPWMPRVRVRTAEPDDFG